MRRTFVLIVVALMLVVALPIGPAGATPPSDVDLVVEDRLPPRWDDWGPVHGERSRGR